MLLDLRGSNNYGIGACKLNKLFINLEEVEDDRKIVS